MCDGTVFKAGWPLAVMGHDYHDPRPHSGFVSFLHPRMPRGFTRQGKSTTEAFRERAGA